LISTTKKGDLKWVQAAKSNLKKNLLGIFHMDSEKYFQNYLNDFGYKLTRRHFGERLFKKVIVVSI
jgi:hypothetical protein